MDWPLPQLLIYLGFLAIIYFFNRGAHISDDDNPMGDETSPPPTQEQTDGHAT